MAKSVFLSPDWTTICQQKSKYIEFLFYFLPVQYISSKLVLVASDRERMADLAFEEESGALMG